MKRLFALLIIASLFQSCEGHLINDTKTRNDVKTALLQKMELYGATSTPFDVFTTELTTPKREALEFLYAYAPITDMNIDHKMISDHVDVTLKAREEMPWADSISEKMFLHFVLPIRVNNENVDSSRAIFYGELRDRVKNMSIKDAALEVNHWCHEKVIYTPSDSRTSSPLQSIKTAYGRCGEESVLTVAALRALGIPARQVYTPRWAHSDDNHAWVEVWGGDKWYYMGACEPEPALDMGWFTAPATRSMLMHTKVFGDYNGTEEVVSKNPSYTEINVTENYAPVKKVVVNVVDADGKAVDNATVDFKIYNYAELYTVASKTTDSVGNASITFGLGDVIVWATKGDKFGFDKLSVKNNDSITVQLNKTVGENIDVEFDIVPPAEGEGTAVAVTPEQRDENSRRLKAEDDIRNSYIATFMTPKEATDLAISLKTDTTVILNLIKASRGNYKNIADFLTSVSPDNLATALQLLDEISAKDLRDISSATLTDHLNGALNYKTNYEGIHFTRYLLNPRVSSEEVTPYRAKFSEIVKGKSVDEIITIVKNIKIADDQNIAVAVVKPEDVMALGVSDSRSRDILFVALARSAGYAARLDESSRKVQYSDGHSWIDVNFDTAPSIAPRGELIVDYNPISTIGDPRYSTHFTFAKLNGTQPSTISMPSNVNHDMGAGRSSKALFSKPLEMDEGEYIAVTGTRMASGEVLAKIKSFKVEQAKPNHLQLSLRENSEDLFVIGSINPEARVTIASSGKESSILDITGRGYFILALIKPNAEPTNHSLRALKSLTSEITAWGRPVVVAVENEDAWKSYKPLEFGELPVKEYVIDSKGEIAAMFEAIKLKTNNLPIYVVADTFGRVVFKSEGYQINLADKLNKVINALKSKK